MSENKNLDLVKDYYGKVLSSSKDLKTSACCSLDTLPLELRNILSDIHPEVKDRFYGCGSPFPQALEGLRVLDLGCGSGRDVYMLSKLVGEAGEVIGLDMTEEQLAVAKRHESYHQEKFGFQKSNVKFIHGYIEDLLGAGLEENSIDLVVSNCVANLSPDKPRVFSQILKVLKPGGELYFSDVFSDRRIPLHLKQDPILLGECLGGAMYTEDFRRLMAEIGCQDVRQVNTNPIELHAPEIKQKIGMVNFQSITFRAFKMDLEDRCEDYGQVGYYQGTIPGHPHSFTLDDHHTFYTQQPMLICGNTADMITQSKYAQFFKVLGDKEIHRGLFDCAPINNSPSGAPAACC